METVWKEGGGGVKGGQRPRQGGVETVWKEEVEVEEEEEEKWKEDNDRDKESGNSLEKEEEEVHARKWIYLTIRE